jgi:hypothetical protein
MAAYPGTLYLCLVGIATAAALVCVVFAGEVRLDACLWLAIAFVASVLYFVTRTASDAGETITQPSRHLPQAGAAAPSRAPQPSSPWQTYLMC